MHDLCTRGQASMAPPPMLRLLALLFLIALPAAAAAAAAKPPVAASKPPIAAAKPPVAAAKPACNITEMLGKFPEFKLFNLLLNWTHLDREINSRKTVTVLVPDNAAVDWLLRRSARMPRAALDELLSVHVVLDYLDAAKLATLPRGRPTVFTTLFQTSGNARNREGFLAVTPTGTGGAVFASAAPGALVNATLKRVVTAKPFNISVLQISNFVVPPGVITRPRPPPAPAPKIRTAAVAPSPAPVPVPVPVPVSMPVPTTPPRVLPTWPIPPASQPDAPAAAPAPSHGHAVQAMSWWSVVGLAVGMACLFSYL